MIGLEIDGEWAEMRQSVWPDLRRTIPQGRTIDFVPHPGGPISDYLTQIEPFTGAPKAAHRLRACAAGSTATPLERARTFRRAGALNST